MYTFCISIEAQDKFLWQAYYALKSYETRMSPSVPFNVVATVAVDRANPYHVEEYEAILNKMTEEFPFFFWLEHDPLNEKGYPRSYHKIAGPSLLSQTVYWDKIYDNIIILDADVWLVKSFSPHFKIEKDELRFWKAEGIAPNFDTLIKHPYGPELVFEAGYREEELKTKFFEHSAYYMVHKDNFIEFFKEQKEMYRKLHPVFVHIDALERNISNYGTWFCEMYAATFTACQDKYTVKFFDDYFHCGNATKEIFYSFCTFLHFFVAEDQVFWNKFWGWTFPFTDKEWKALENAANEIPKGLLVRGLYANSYYILKTLLKYKDLVNQYRGLRPLDYNDLDTLPKSHKSTECPYCIKTLEG